MIYIRRVGEVGDGAVTADKLANGAVDLSTSKVTGQLPTGKLENGAVNEDKLANLAVSTGKLKDQAVSLAKAQQAMKIHHFVGDETEVSVTGISEEGVKTFQLPRATSVNSGIQPSKLHVNAEVKVTGVSGAQGTLKVYIDSEGTPRMTINTTSDTYEMAEANADISDLTNGKHSVTIKLVSDDGSAIMWNDLIEIFLEK